MNNFMNLLEQYNYKLTEEELIKILLSYKEPIKIADNELDCRERTETMEKEFLGQLRGVNDVLTVEIDQIIKEFEMIQGFEHLAEFDTASCKC
jgi:hypothetical protein